MATMYLAEKNPYLGKVFRVEVSKIWPQYVLRKRPGCDTEFKMARDTTSYKMFETYNEAVQYMIDMIDEKINDVVESLALNREKHKYLIGTFKATEYPY